jgi:uncharacterized protein
VARPSTRVRLRVSPHASDAHVVGRHGEAWKVRVAAPPERGKANDAVLELLAEALRVPSTRLAVVTGARGRDKTVSVVGLTEDEVERRLTTAAESI